MQLTVKLSHDAEAQDSQRAAAARLRQQRLKRHCEDQEEAQSWAAATSPLGSDRACKSKTAVAATGTPIRKLRKHVEKSPNSLAKLIMDWAQLPEKGPDRRQAVAKVCEEHDVSPS